MKTFPRILLVTAIGAVVAGGAFFVVKARLAQMNPEVLLNQKSVQPNSRPAPAPSGSLEVSLVRSELPQASAAGYSDKHDILLSTDSAGEYDLYSGGQTKHLKAVAPNVRYNLTASGQLIQLAGERITSGSSPLTYPYNESADRPKFFSDGSRPVVRKNVTLKADTKPPKGDFYVLTREIQKTTDQGSPITENSGPNQSSPDQRISAIPQGFFNVPVKSDELLVTTKRLTILATDDQSSVWLSAASGHREKAKESLLKFTGTKQEEVPLPSGYSNIHRVVVTGDTVAATFGVLNGAQPFRSFVSQGKDWKELPLPNGSDCSFVQQVFSNGEILGYVTTWEGKNLKHVVWKGDALAVLDDLPSWPKHGEVSLVTRSSRAGDICVRNITDLASGASEYYLLTLKL